MVWIFVSKIFEGGFLVKGGADTLYGHSWLIVFHKCLLKQKVPVVGRDFSVVCMF